jgi:hypothetical protein
MDEHVYWLLEVGRPDQIEHEETAQILHKSNGGKVPKKQFAQARDIANVRLAVTLHRPELVAQVFVLNVLI